MKRGAALTFRETPHCSIREGSVNISSAGRNIYDKEVPSTFRLLNFPAPDFPTTA